jgi:two-component system, cell cycle sensor histidine kinase and response regulator CckA
MSEPINVLIVEDTIADARLMMRELERTGFAPDWIRVETESDYLSCLERPPDVILADSNLPQFDGLHALDMLRQRNLDIPFILVSGRMGEDLAVDAMSRGADDYLLKDRLARLGEAVRRAMERRRLRRERAGAIEALRDSKERYRLVSEISSDYAYSLEVTPDGTPTCEWITEPFTRITGFVASEINSRGWLSLYHPEDVSIAERHHQMLLSNQSDSIEARIITSDNRTCWVRVYGRPIWDDSEQRVVRIFGATQDITAQKHLEQQLLHAQKMEAIGQLAGGIAHDFNNLLTVISGYGQIMRDQPAAGGQSGANPEYLDAILKAADRASQLTRQLLAFSRRQVLRLKTIELNTLVIEVEKMLQRVIGEDVELRTIFGSDAGLVKVDPGQMEQVIMNLAVNARDAMPDGGRLTIETSHVELDETAASPDTLPKTAPFVLLTVSDTGIGMDKETIARIFEPFFTTKEVGKGTGLGLAMVYGIIKQSGGNVQVESAPGRGTTFRVYLPRVVREEETAVEPALLGLTGHHGSETILVVEDEETVRNLIRQILDLKGYTVLHTGDVDEAVKICEHHVGRIALLITDVILPGMSGPQVAARARELRPGIRVLYASGYTDNALSPYGVEVGVNFLQKPFTPDALVGKVRDVLSAPRSSSAGASAQ